jgi:hypothetical protein
MSLTETIIEGTLQSDGTLVLDEKPKLPAGRVTVVLRLEMEKKELRPLGNEFFQMLKEIGAGQKARNHVPRTGEQIESERRALNDEMEIEIEETIKLQEESRRLRKQTESETGAS